MSSKPSLAQVQASNATATWSYRPTAIFVGGTSGVGEAAAKAFAQATKGFAHIIIIGRSRPRAKAIISTFPRVSDSKYEFISCDVSDMRNITSTSKELKEKVNVTKINYLALSQGGYPFGPAQPCLNGIDRRMVLEFYSRWKFTDELLPLLEAAASMGEEARVLIIKGSIQQQSLDINDLGFRNNASAMAQTRATSVYNNTMVERHPTLSFCHMYPGLVNTPGYGTIPWWLKPMVFLAKFFMISPDESGQRSLFVLLRPGFRQGGFYVDQYAEPAEAPMGTQEVRDAWSITKKRFLFKFACLWFWACFTSSR